MSEMLVCYIVPADLKDRRGLPMSIFSAAALGGTGLGPVVAGWIELNPKLEWRWIQWIQMMRVYFSFPKWWFNIHLHRNCGAYSVLVPLIMRETRSSILLTRLAKKIRKETGDRRYRARIEDERTSLGALIFISCTRPIRMSSFRPWTLKLTFASIRPSFHRTCCIEF